MPHSELRILDAPDLRDVQFLEDRVDEHNLAHTGITDVRLLAIFLRDSGDDIVAGVYGWTWGGSCEIRTFWVHERWRGRGVGTQLMKAAEEEARVRGTSQIVLSTHSFQAPDFYRRLGFESVGQVEDYPAGHQSIYMRKRLVAATEI